MNTPETENPKLQKILEGGEKEWLENAPWTYGDDAINVWEEEILPRFLIADLKEIDVEDLRLYCPLMLAQLQSVFMHDHIEDICEAIARVLEIQEN